MEFSFEEINNIFKILCGRKVNLCQCKIKIYKRKFRGHGLINNGVINDEFLYFRFMNDFNDEISKLKYVER